MIETFCRYLHAHRRLSLPLFEKMFDAGFALTARRPGASFPIHERLDDLRDDPDAICAELKGYSRRHKGELTLSFERRTLARVVYDDGWSAVVHLDFIGAEDVDLPELQRQILGVFELSDFETLVDLWVGLLEEIADRPFAYELYVGDRAFLRGKLAARTLKVSLIDAPTVVKIIFFFMRKGDATVLVRSPLDVMRLAEQGQSSLRYIADAYEEKDLAAAAEVGGETIFRCGRGVKPLLGSRFGATALQLDAIARLFMSAMPGRG
jgi:hypothetical protein